MRRRSASISRSYPRDPDTTKYEALDAKKNEKLDAKIYKSYGCKKDEDPENMQFLNSTPTRGSNYIYQDNLVIVDVMLQRRLTSG